jgi:hypothetical protein
VIGVGDDLVEADSALVVDGMDLVSWLQLFDRDVPDRRADQCTISNALVNSHLLGRNTADTISIQEGEAEEHLGAVLEAPLEHRVDGRRARPEIPHRRLIDQRPDVLRREPADLLVAGRDEQR